jgi:hypothetical protein
MIRVAPILATLIAAGVIFDFVDALGAFADRAPDSVNWLAAVGELAFLVATVLCVILAVRRKQLAFVWMLAPLSGALLAAGYYVHTPPYCNDCRDSTTLPSAEPWVFAVAGACLISGAVAARWPPISSAATALTLLAAVALGLVIGYHTIS